MTNKTNFNPDGNLFVKGGITAEGTVVASGTGQSSIAGELAVFGTGSYRRYCIFKRYTNG